MGLYSQAANRVLLSAQILWSLFHALEHQMQNLPAGWPLPMPCLIASKIYPVQLWRLSTVFVLAVDAKLHWLVLFGWAVKGLLSDYLKPSWGFFLAGGGPVVY